MLLSSGYLTNLLKSAWKIATPSIAASEDHPVGAHAEVESSTANATTITAATISA